MFAVTVLVNGANFGFNYGAVHLLGLSSYSAVAALLAIILIFSVPANVIQAIVTTLVGESRALGKPQSAALGQSVSLVAFGVSAVIAIVGLVLMTPVAGYLSIPDPYPVFFAFFSVALGFSTAALRGVLQGQQRYGAFSISLMCEAGGNLVYGLAFIALFHSVWGAILGNVCAAVTALAFSVFSVWKEKAGDRAVLDLRRTLTKFVGTTVALGALAAMSWVDVLLVRHLAPVPLAGLYGAMSIVGKIVLLSISFVPFVLISRAAKLRGENRSTRSLVAAMAIIGVTICGVDLLLVRIMPGPILNVLAGARAVAAEPYLFGYTAALSALALTTIVANYGIGTHRFAFAIPLALIEIGEIVAINLRHATLADVIDVIFIGHSAALLVTTAFVAASTMRDRRYRLILEGRHP